jgi:hypothetical protein
VSYFEDLSLRSVWLATSGDDGKTWRNEVEVARLPEGQQPDGEGTNVQDAFLAVHYADGMPAIRTPDNLTLVGIEHHNYIHPPDWSPGSPIFWQSKPNSGARATLVVLDYNPAGTAEPDQASVVFKRTKPNLI